MFGNISTRKPLYSYTNTNNSKAIIMKKYSIAFMFVVITLFSGWHGYAMVNERLVEIEQSAETEKSGSIINANYCHAVKRSDSQKRIIFNSYFLRSQTQVNLSDQRTTHIKTPLFIKFRVLRY